MTFSAPIYRDGGYQAFAKRPVQHHVVHHVERWRLTSREQHERVGAWLVAEAAARLRPPLRAATLSETVALAVRQ
jgi:hypothetical protein